MKKNLMCLICLLLVGAMLFCSCDLAFTNEGETNPEAITQAGSSSETKKQTETKTSTEDTKPKRVSNISGKTAREVVEKFFYTYKSSTSFDISSDYAFEIDGEIYEQRADLKVNGNDLYMLLKSDGSRMEIWSVGGTLYADMDGEKYKTSGGIEEYLGMDLSELLGSYMREDLDETYLKKFENAKIYLENGTYYFTVNFTADEAFEIEGEYEAFSETFYCKADCTVKAVHGEYQSGALTAVNFNSYGKPVTITAPKNADEFLEDDFGGDWGDDDLDDGWGDDFGDENFWEEKDFWDEWLVTKYPDLLNVDQESYIVYLMLCDMLSSADAFSLYLSVNSESYCMYQTADGNEYVYSYSSTFSPTYSELWYINGKAYASKGSGSPARLDENTEDYAMVFEQVWEAVFEAICPIHYTDIAYLYKNYQLNGRPFVQFQVGTDWYDYVEYQYTYAPDMSEIHVMIVYYERGEAPVTVDCYFSGIDSEFIMIGLPA